jgi:hypothetical protein
MASGLEAGIADNLLARRTAAHAHLRIVCSIVMETMGATRFMGSCGMARNDRIVSIEARPEPVALDLAHTAVQLQATISE